MVKCPWCDEDIKREVSAAENWDEPEFEMECPKCCKPLCVSVEVAEYEYEVEKGEVTDDE